MWQTHMRQLFAERLAVLPVQVIWKAHAAIHFGGATGAETGCKISHSPPPTHEAVQGTACGGAVEQLPIWSCLVSAVPMM